MRKPGRPLGPIAIAVLDILRVRCMTAREAGKLLVLSKQAAEIACSRLMSYGLIEVKELCAVAGCKKRVRVYQAVRGCAHRPAMMIPQAFFGDRS